MLRILGLYIVTLGLIKRQVQFECAVLSRSNCGELDVLYPVQSNGLCYLLIGIARFMICI